MKNYYKAISSSTILTSVIAVILLISVPVTVSGDSLADKRTEAPPETWGNQEIELERAILTEQLPSTAAGSASVEQEPIERDSHMSSRMEDGMEQNKSASHYKREVFGSNR